MPKPFSNLENDVLCYPDQMTYRSFAKTRTKMVSESINSCSEWMEKYIYGNVSFHKRFCRAEI